jgi:flagellar protein FlbT
LPARLAGRGIRMPLKLELKPGERIILGKYVLATSERTRLTFLNDDVTILREKDIMMPEQADTPAKRIYLAVQLMYVSSDPTAEHEVYFALVRDILQAAPSTRPYIDQINDHILAGRMYKALQEVKKLVAYEQTLLDGAKPDAAGPEPRACSNGKK